MVSFLVAQPNKVMRLWILISVGLVLTCVYNNDNDIGNDDHDSEDNDNKE